MKRSMTLRVANPRPLPVARSFGALAFLPVQGAQASWEPAGPIEVLRWLGPALLAAVVATALVVAWRQRRRFVAGAMLSESERADVASAVREAERRTVGEVVPVVFARSDRHAAAPWRAAAFAVPFASACLVAWLPWQQPAWLLACQLAIGAGAWSLVRALRPLARLFVREHTATETSEEQAYVEFHRLRLHETAGRTGVLLFVSLFERRVVVLADRGVDAQAGGAHVWAAAKDAVLEGVARGSLRDGLVAGVAEVGEVLARCAPWTEGDRNELPDRLIVQE